MKHALMLIAALFLLTGCSSLLKHVPGLSLGIPATLTAKCPDLEPVNPADMGDLLQVAVETSIQYRECATRHNALVDAIK